jgi:maltose operon protein
MALFAFLFIGGLTLSGCSSTSAGSWLDPLEAKSPIYTGVPATTTESLQQLQSASICCSSLDQIPFQPLDTAHTKYYEINGESPAYAFATGKSFFSAFELPDDLNRATIAIDVVAGATVFAPTVLILDEHFAVSRAIESDQFKYTPAEFMEPQRLKGVFSFDRRPGTELAREKYFIVFTTDEDLRGSTQMISEARLYARVRGLADPALPDPVAEHAATGVIRIATRDLETSPRATRSYVPEQQSAQRYLKPAAVTPQAAAPAPVPVPPGEPKAKPSAETQPKPSVEAQPRPKPSGKAQPMLSETQAIYDRLIREAVTQGDMDRAWRLVQEAERAGSATARHTFIEAVERK